MAQLTLDGAGLTDEFGNPLIDDLGVSDVTVFLSLLENANIVYAPVITGGAVAVPSPYRYVAFRI